MLRNPCGKMDKRSIEPIDVLFTRDHREFLFLPRDPLRIIGREASAAGEPFKPEDPIKLIDQP